MNSPKGTGGPRRSRRSLTTRSGKSLKLNQSFGDRWKAHKLTRGASKAAYLSTLPKDRWKRILYRLHPKRVAEFWFSREGAIMALKIIGIGIVVCFFLTIGLFAYFRKDLPQVRDISGDKLGGSITYYDRTGQTVLWQDYDAAKRIPVSDDNITDYMKQATVAIEDKDFYKHGAFDVRGIMRAGLHDLVGGGGSVQGGSTITQQLVKLNEQWTDNRTVTRKVKELILSVELEREYSKKDILTAYLNVAPYGGVEYGVETAARDYFHSDAKHLTLAQASMLAAIPQAPSYYSPYSSSQFNSAAGNTFNKTALLNRQHYILDQMVKQGMITQTQADQAKGVDVLAEVHPLESKYNGIKAPYFVLAAKQEVDQKYKTTTSKVGGWKVITTLDMDKQNEAERLVQQNLSTVKRYGGDEEATVMEDVPTGQIVALVGGVDFADPDHGRINYASQTLIAPGSSFKPYDYSTLINNNSAGAGSVFYDSQDPVVDPVTGAGYACTDKRPPDTEGKGGNCIWDFSRTFPGPETIRYALGGSRNVPAVKAITEAGIGKTISTASAMMNPGLKNGQSAYNCYGANFTKTIPCGPAAGIGDGAYLHLDDHVNGLATLGRLGKAVPRTYILKITDSGGKTLTEWSKTKTDAASKQVIDPQTAYIVNNMLSDPNASYFSAGVKFQHWNGWDFAVKTGTTNFNFDSLMTSFSTKYAVVTWAGYHTRNQAISGSSDTVTYAVTAGLMKYAHQNLKPDNWQEPKGIQHLPAFVIRSHVGYGSVEPSPSTDIFPSWYKPNGTSGSAQTIDKVSGKVATSCTPAGAKDTVGNGNANVWNVDIFHGGKLIKNSGSTSNGTGNSSQATDDVHSCSDSPPSISLTLPANCDSSCTITASVSQGTHPLSDAQYPNYPGTVTFALDGQTIHTENVSDSPTTVSFTYTPSSNGSGTVTATVTDSVLYSASDSGTLNFSSAPVGGTNKTIVLTASSNGANTKSTFTWAGGSGGSYTVYKSDGTQLCTGSGAASSCTATGSYKGSKVYVQDDQGNKSKDVTVT